MPRSEAGDDCDTVTRSVTHMARHQSRPCRDAQQQTDRRKAVPPFLVLLCPTEEERGGTRKTQDRDCVLVRVAEAMG